MTPKDHMNEVTRLMQQGPMLQQLSAVDLLTIMHSIRMLLSRRLSPSRPRSTDLMLQTKGGQSIFTRPELLAMMIASPLNKLIPTISRHIAMPIRKANSLGIFKDPYNSERTTMA